jgi:hypothetical protein
MHVQCNIETRSCNLCCSEKTIGITYSEHVFVALGMQCACTILSSVACPAVQYFSTLPHKRHDFRKTKLNIKCVYLFSLQLLSGTFLILRKIEQDMIKSVYFLYVKYPFF